MNSSKNIISFNPFKGPQIEKVVPITQPQAEIWISCTLGGDDAIELIMSLSL